MPAQHSIIFKDASALDANIDCLLNHITLDSEKKVFLSHLNDLEQLPGQNLAEISYDLNIIYQNYIVLEQLSVKSHKDERREFAKKTYCCQ